MAEFNVNKSIIAQSSAAAASNIVAALVASGELDGATVVDEFDRVRLAIFNGTIALAGAEAVEVPSNRVPATRPEGGAAGGAGDPGNFDFRIGKHRGKTIREVDAIPANAEGKDDGRGYLVWAAGALNNNFMKARIQEYLDANPTPATV